MYKLGIQLLRLLVTKYAEAQRVHTINVRLRKDGASTSAHCPRSGGFAGRSEGAEGGAPPEFADASICFTTNSASAIRPFEISHRGDSGKRSNNQVMNRPGIPPIKNRAFQPQSGMTSAPAWLVVMRPIGKIISYNMKNFPRPRALESSLM